MVALSKVRRGMLVASGILVLCTPLQAREGLYIGGQAGWAENYLEIESAKGFGGTGAAGNLMAGYGFRGSAGFLSVEVNAGVSSSEASFSAANFGSSATATDVTVSANDSYGIGFLAGMNTVGNTALFARLGWQTTNFEYKENTPFKEDNNHDGARVGFGVLMPVDNNLDFRAEWHRTFYGEESYANKAFDIEPAESQFLIGISKRFW